MTTAEQGGREAVSQSHPSITLRRLSWPHLVAISILGFAINFHWSAIGIIILPSQVVKMVGEDMKGGVLAAIIAPAAFVSLFANPLFGMLSDQMRGRLARWGKRRPYIVIGTIFNVGALVWMVLAPNPLLLGIGFSLLQFFSNAVQAPFHALLPDIVPASQRGKASGFIGLLGVLGNIGGVVIAGKFGFVDARKPLDAYQQGLWIAYGIIIAVLILFMLITIFSVRERQGVSAQMDALEEQEAREANRRGGEQAEKTHPRERRWRRPTWLTRSFLLTVAGTLAVIVLLWGMMWLWNTYRVAGIPIHGDIQQVVLMVVATVGLLRIFQFDPRRHPDFSWVLVTRMVMALGIYVIQTFLQYYLRDVVRVPDPEGQAANFVIIVALASIFSSFLAGWLSDSLGRKRLIYISGGLMAVVGVVFILIHDLSLVLIVGAIFGMGYGAYGTVDWALVADVLPSPKTYARDMGVWNVSLSLPQVIAPVVGGPLIDTFKQSGQVTTGYQILFTLAIAFCLIGTVTVRFIKGVKK